MNVLHLNPLDDALGLVEFGNLVPRTFSLTIFQIGDLKNGEALGRRLLPYAENEKKYQDPLW